MGNHISVVQDHQRAADICFRRLPGAGLSRAQWLANAVLRSIEHDTGVGAVGALDGYASALRQFRETEALALIEEKEPA